MSSTGSINYETDHKIETLRDRNTKTEIIKETIKQEIRYPKFNPSYKVGSFHEAPEFLRDNEYITHGYRVGFTSVKHVLKR
jgi:hypothetical protein